MRICKRFYLKTAAVSLLVITAAIMVTNHSASARSPRPTAVELIGFGAVAVSQGQGMRVNLVNALESTTIQLSVKFVDNNGQVLKSEQILLSGGSTSATVTYIPTYASPSATIPAVRTPVHVIVESVPDAPEVPSPFVLPSLEVFDRKSGQVSFFQGSFQRLSTAVIIGE
jgi:hypothetical protein